MTYTWKIDRTAPVLPALPAGGDLGCNPAEPVCDDTLKATDNCDGEVAVVCAAGAITGEDCAKQQVFTYTATDACGNAATGTVTYTWKIDRTAPVLPALPAGGDLGCDPQLPSCAEDLVAVDNCDGEVALVCTPGSITGDDVAKSQVFSYTATDKCGNTSTGTVIYTWRTYCPAAIGDRVWFDINGDGVQNTNEPGLPNVGLSLYMDVAGNGNFTSLVETAMTDTNGLYLFDDLVPRAYVVVVDVTTLLGFRQTGDPDYYDQPLPEDQRDNRTTSPVVLASGDTFLNADFGYQPIPLISVIGNVEAFTRDGQTVVRWETVESWNTAGYYLERQTGEDWVRISENLVPYPLFGTAPIIFEETDAGAAAGGTYTWRLVELESSGSELVYGPYVLTVDGAGRTYETWAVANFNSQELADPGVSGPDADPDGDGLSNWQEFLAGTNPRNANSVLQISEVRKVPEGLALSWDSVAGRSYSIAVSTSLVARFLPLEGTIIGQSDKTQKILPVDFTERQMYFQVITKGP